MVTPPTFDRSSGVLLHLTSLPSRYGIGDLGPAAMHWVDWLASTGTRYWQLLPLGPTGFGDSPYSPFSSFAGNVALVSPDSLAEEGLLTRDELTGVGRDDRVVYTEVMAAKSALISLALERLDGAMEEEFHEFRRAEASWVEPYAEFMAIKGAHHGSDWTLWPEEIRHRDPHALGEVHRSLQREIEEWVFGQFVFYHQLGRLRKHAADSGVEIIGDVPLYVAPDSVDVWMDPGLFSVDMDTGRPTVVSGVPPDMFSKSGQWWGTPLYEWDLHAEDLFAWWQRRLAAFYRQADVLRIDHFTGLVQYYEIGADAPNAMHGVWRKGPGVEFFEAMEDKLGPLPIILEDLGPIGDVVEPVRAELGYPGMTIAQESFALGPDNHPLPANIPPHRVAYTGTHDNDTALGRFNRESAAYRKLALECTGGNTRTYVWDLIEAIWTSDAVISVTPVQDLLVLGTEARMNYPGTAEGNWQWRMPPGSASKELAERLGALNARARRSVG